MNETNHVTAEQAIEQAYPLDCEDGSLGSITMSLVLQRFDPNQVNEVLTHWIDKLAPGGRMRISVPDFQQIAKQYLAQEPIDLQSLVMGQQSNGADRNASLFDEETLTEGLIGLGMERIRRYDESDCVLSLESYKPSGPCKTCPNTVGVLSAPRFGPTIHQQCAHAAFGSLGIPYTPVFGAYWNQALCERIEKFLAEPHPFTGGEVEFVVTCDFDSIFQPLDLLELYRLIRSCEKADAICAVQTMRGASLSLFSINDEKGVPQKTNHSGYFDRYLSPISTGHFGLTILRASTLRKLPRPWMLPKPNKDGRWGADRVDADIDFWHRFAKDGRQLYLANRIVIGHMEECIVWPGKDNVGVRQSVREFCEGGMPIEVRRAIP